jgi:hypothetical protein
MGARAGGKSQRDEMKLYRAIDLATSSAMRALRDDPQRRQEGAWQVAVNEALEKFDLMKQPAAASIAQRVTERVRNGFSSTLSRARDSLETCGQAKTRMRARLWTSHGRRTRPC